MSTELAIFEDPIEDASTPEAKAAAFVQRLEIAPEEEPVKAVMEVQLEPAAMPLMQILPADFKLPDLIKFVPNAEVKEALDKAHTYALSIEIEGKGPEALALIDTAMNELKTRIERAVAEFDDPAAIAFSLHRSITSKRAEWVTQAQADYKRLGTAVWKETERLKAEAEKERQRLQAIEDQKVRVAAAAQLATAQAAKAPPAVVERMEAAVQTAVAPPVAFHRPVAMAANTVVTTWKARLASTPENAEVLNPDITKLSESEMEDLKTFLKAIVDGRTDLLAHLSIEWGALNKQAVASEATFKIPGFVAFKTGGTRAKGTRGRRS